MTALHVQVAPVENRVPSDLPVLQAKEGALGRVVPTAAWQVATIIADPDQDGSLFWSITAVASDAQVIFGDHDMAAPAAGDYGIPVFAGQSIERSARPAQTFAYKLL